MSVSAIEWTDRTWNPVRGCSRVSEGCRNCYAERMAARFAVAHAGPRTLYGDKPDSDTRFAKMTPAGPRWTGRVQIIWTKVNEPLKWRKPQRVFVNSMSDLFHEDLPDHSIDAVFATMAAAPLHTFQILTKRPARMLAYMQRVERQHASYRANGGFDWGAAGAVSAVSNTRAGQTYHRWPLPNVWLGVSVEDQATADVRIPLLLQTPAAVRFVSYEPALGPVDFGQSGVTCSCCPRPAHRWIRVTENVRSDFADLMPETARHVGPGVYRAESNPHGALSVAGLGIKPEEFERLPGLDWIIVGGESGPGARPFDVEWARSTVRQCKAAGVPVFVKQLGAWPLMRWIGGPLLNDGRSGSAYADRCALGIYDKKGGDPAEWPEDLRVREFPG